MADQVLPPLAEESHDMDVAKELNSESGKEGAVSRRCFVISPIGAYGSDIRNHMDTVFHCIIHPALRDKYNVIRGDHVARPGRITEQFVEDIIGNDLIVCVLTGNNPNVYYELAIAESAARPIIVLRQRDDVVPFDVKDVRFIEYDLDPRRIYDGYYVDMVRRAEEELSPGDKFEGKVPFAPSLTPLGSSRLNFDVAQRYDEISPQVTDVLTAAQDRFFFSGVSLRGWISNEGFLTLLQDKAKQGVTCRILIMGCDNPAISQMLNRGASDREAKIRHNIKEVYEILSQKSIPRRFEVRMAQRGIIYQQMCMSEQTMIWAPHLYSRQTGQAPALRIDVDRSLLHRSGLESLYLAMRDEFEQLWSENAPR